MLWIISLRYQAVARTSSMGCDLVARGDGGGLDGGGVEMPPFQRLLGGVARTGVGATAPKATRTLLSTPSWSLPAMPMEMVEMSSAGRVPCL
jgi:hypothetical protein